MKAVVLALGILWMTMAFVSSAKAETVSLSGESLIGTVELVVNDFATGVMANKERCSVQTVKNRNGNLQVAITNGQKKWIAFVTIPMNKRVTFVSRGNDDVSKNVYSIVQPNGTVAKLALTTFDDTAEYILKLTVMGKATTCSVKE